MQYLLRLPNVEPFSSLKPTKLPKIEKTENRPKTKKTDPETEIRKEAMLRSRSDASQQQKHLQIHQKRQYNPRGSNTTNRLKPVYKVSAKLCKSDPRLLNCVYFRFNGHKIEKENFDVFGKNQIKFELLGKSIDEDIFELIDDQGRPYCIPLYQQFVCIDTRNLKVEFSVEMDTVAGEGGSGVGNSVMRRRGAGKRLTSLTSGDGGAGKVKDQLLGCRSEEVCKCVLI